MGQYLLIGLLAVMLYNAGYHIAIGYKGGWKTLGDAKLSVDGIARALNCSRRHLYNTLAGEGESVAAYIQRMRLQACVRDLQNANAPARPITDITTYVASG